MTRKLYTIREHEHHVLPSLGGRVTEYEPDGKITIFDDACRKICRMIESGVGIIFNPRFEYLPPEDGEPGKQAFDACYIEAAIPKPRMDETMEPIMVSVYRKQWSPYFTGGHESERAFCHIVRDMHDAVKKAFDELNKED